MQLHPGRITARNAILSAISDGRPLKSGSKGILLTVLVLTVHAMVFAHSVRLGTDELSDPLVKLAWSCIPADLSHDMPGVQEVCWAPRLIARRAALHFRFAQHRQLALRQH